MINFTGLKVTFLVPPKIISKTSNIIGRTLPTIEGTKKLYTLAASIII
ncbi:hypothetical protein [Sinomicrobium sp. M5D2P17]